LLTAWSSAKNFWPSRWHLFRPDKQYRRQLPLVAGTPNASLLAHVAERFAPVGFDERNRIIAKSG
jgi:hypothetical protein